MISKYSRASLRSLKLAADRNVVVIREDGDWNPTVLVDGKQHYNTLIASLPECFTAKRCVAWPNVINLTLNEHGRKVLREQAAIDSRGRVKLREPRR